MDWKNDSIHAALLVRSRDTDVADCAPTTMLTSDFDFHLPDRLVASHAVPRGRSRMLVVTEAELTDTYIRELSQYLKAGDTLVVNDTKVIPARLFAVKELHEQPDHDHDHVNRSQLELLLIEKIDAATWSALAKPGRKAKLRSRWSVVDARSTAVEGFEVTGRPDSDSTQRGVFTIRFDQPIEPQLDSVGHVPLPPYIQRPDTLVDRDRYQTVYAAHEGAIAAPTAGLHFTDSLLTGIQEHGVELARVTLHVGIGTFKPITSTLAHEHEMDAERYWVSEETAETLNRTRQRGGRIVAVGTTVVRTLESAINDHGLIQAGEGSTVLFILPGYRFRAVDALLTNFHLPRSTLLMLVSAFAGKDRVLEAYRHAIASEYRFYSYGDCMLLHAQLTS